MLIIDASPRLWTPADLPIGTLSVWLDAADLSTITLATGVSQWRDKSGNDAHATQATAANQPAYSQTEFFGLPGITFDGSNDSLSISTTQIQNTTHGVYWVFVRRGTGVTGDAYKPSVGVLAGATDRGALHYVKNSNNLGASYPYFGGPSGVSYDLSSGTAYNNTNAQVMAFQSNVTGWGVWRNGSLEGTTNGISAPNNTNLGFTLAAQANPLRFSNITMTDFILLRTTNTSIRQIVEGYLAWKPRLISEINPVIMGLTANLPTAHPFKNRPPLVSDI